MPRSSSSFRFMSSKLSVTSSQLLCKPQTRPLKAKTLREIQLPAMNTHVGHVPISLVWFAFLCFANILPSQKLLSWPSHILGRRVFSDFFLSQTVDWCKTNEPTNPKIAEFQWCFLNRQFERMFFFLFFFFKLNNFSPRWCHREPCRPDRHTPRSWGEVHLPPAWRVCPLHQTCKHRNVTFSQRVRANNGFTWKIHGQRSATVPLVSRVVSSQFRQLAVFFQINSIPTFKYVGLGNDEQEAAAQGQPPPGGKCDEVFYWWVRLNNVSGHEVKGTRLKGPKVRSFLTRSLLK